ncbi:sigma-70 family RNA polymerase sigma factor [Kitasatospora sp. NPDC058190]|uniref:sigma-70 family RNA polymerase sigma factor n=1 Tax=Kitasatospora sp. NPDC058190 TaxID=3346371 RepID=UPI0036D86040
MTHHDHEELTALVQAAQQGDALALDELLSLLMPYVGRVCAPIALQDAPDAAQEAMIAIVRGLRQLKAPAALFGWARTIAAREAVRFATRRSPEPTASTDQPDDHDPELATDIQDVLERLPPAHRAILTLRHIEGLDEKSVSEILDLPLGTVRSRLFRARHGFRTAWGAEHH